MLLGTLSAMLVQTSLKLYHFYLSNNWCVVHTAFVIFRCPKMLYDLYLRLPNVPKVLYDTELPLGGNMLCVLCENIFVLLSY